MRLQARKQLVTSGYQTTGQDSTNYNEPNKNSLLSFFSHLIVLVFVTKLAPHHDSLQYALS